MTICRLSQFLSVTYYLKGPIWKKTLEPLINRIDSASLLIDYQPTSFCGNMFTKDWMEIMDWYKTNIAISAKEVNWNELECCKTKSMNYSRSETSHTCTSKWQLFTSCLDLLWELRACACECVCSMVGDYVTTLLRPHRIFFRIFYYYGMEFKMLRTVK